MNRRIISLLFFAILFTQVDGNAQGYFGWNMDNYAGVQGVVLNPAELGNSRTAFEINVASASAFLTNDYLQVSFSPELISEFDDFWQESVNRNPLPGNELHANLDVIGPSLMLRTGKFSGVALTTRLRGLYSIDNFPGPLLEGIQNEFDAVDEFDLSVDGHRSLLHAYGEIGFNYGRVVHQSRHSQLKVGGAVKYLQGVGSVFTASRSLTANYTENNNRVSFEGDIAYGRTSDFDYDDFSSESLTGGFGFDLGVAFEWYGSQAIDSSYLPPYRLKVGASVTDIGKIGYEQSTRGDYLLSGSVPTDDLEGYTIESILQDNFDGAESEGSLDVSLPTRLNLMLDLRLAGKLYVSAVVNKSLGGDGESGIKGPMPTIVAVTPRLQTKALGLYAPVVFGGYEGPTMGAGLRFWIVTVGSGSLLTDLIRKESPYGTDVYVGLKLPFFKSNKKPKPQPAAQE